MIIVKMIFNAGKNFEQKRMLKIMDKEIMIYMEKGCYEIVNYLRVLKEKIIKK